MNQETFARDLMELEVVRFGNFTLKSGLSSPFYLDLRQLLKDPVRMDRAAELLAEKARRLEFDVIAGIPYTAVPLAALAAVKLGKPLIIPRKETKAYGTGGAILGHYNPGDTCLVLDDLVTTGGSKLETAALLEREGLKVKDFLVLIDRRPAGGDELEGRGYGLTSLFSLPELTAELERGGLLAPEKGQEIRDWLNRPAEKAPVSPGEPGPVQPVADAGPLNRKLRELMEKKQSNLVLSLDVTRKEEFFRVLSLVEDKIVILKTHGDILEDFDMEFAAELKRRSRQKGFLIFEDRKFADIGNTVRHQYRGGLHRISDWSDFVTVHMIAGPGTLEGLFEGTREKGGFLLARMSSQGNLISPEYSRQVIEEGSRRPEWVCGYIGHGTDAADIREFKSRIPRGQLLLMPGVQLKAGGDGLGQQYLSLEEAVSGGADLVIVGRGLYQSENPAETSETYRARGWKALQERIQKEGR